MLVSFLHLGIVANVDAATIFLHGAAVALKPLSPPPPPLSSSLPIKKNHPADDASITYMQGPMRQKKNLARNITIPAVTAALLLFIRKNWKTPPPSEFIFQVPTRARISYRSSCSTGVRYPWLKSSARGTTPERRGSTEGEIKALAARSWMLKYATRWCVTPRTVALRVLLQSPLVLYVPKTNWLG